MEFLLLLLCNFWQAQVVVEQPEVFRAVTLQNSTPRQDSDGEIIDAHDGCLHFFGDSYYLYGTAYGQSAGFGINNRYRVYRSPDLEHWQFAGELLEEPPRGTYFRPYVVFNPTTQKYVLWFNWYPQLWEGQIGVAVSDTPVGPFSIVNADVQLSQADNQPGDGSLFVDDDGTGYFIYTVIGEDHAIRIERLTSDFLGSTGEVSDILARNCEAPVMFRRGSLYYALFDSCCCFCPEGSGAQVYTATAPLGPYTLRGNINRDAQGALDRPSAADLRRADSDVPGGGVPLDGGPMGIANRWDQGARSAILESTAAIRARGRSPQVGECPAVGGRGPQR